MGYLIYLVIGLIIVSSLSATAIKRFRKNKRPANNNVVSKIEKQESSETVTTIKEVLEKLVPNAEVVPNAHHYFVRTRSFPNQENVRKFQA